MAENYVNLQIQQTKQITNRINTKTTSRKITFKLLTIKNNKKFLDTVRKDMIEGEKQIRYHGNHRTLEEHF